MDYRLTFVILICILVTVTAYTYQDPHLRSKRDVMESMKSAWEGFVRTLSDAGDAVVNVFSPTEKTIDKYIADIIKPTEKSILAKVSDELGK